MEGMRKRATKHLSSEDRISQLPNKILGCILSWLPLKEAGRTSILSRRWIQTWAYVTVLDFDGSTKLSTSSFEGYKNKYVDWVNMVLDSYKSEVLEKLRISCHWHSLFREEVDKWLKYAFNRRVQRLELDLTHGGLNVFPVAEMYTFPSALVGLRSGKSLQNNNLLCEFKSLKALSLKRVNVSGEVLDFFLHNCQFLESLVVHESDDLIDLEVCGPSLALQHLEISG